MTDSSIAANMPVTTAFDFPHWEVERYVGPVFGLIVRSMGFAKGIGASFKALAGGEVTQYTRLLEDSRRHAMDRMIENARLLGATDYISGMTDSFALKMFRRLHGIELPGTIV